MVLKNKKLILSFILALLCVTAGFTQSGSKVALVFGNASYKNSKLENPIKDAKAMESKLKELGFSVTLVLDADTEKMDEELRKFYSKAKNADLGLLYYSGHGIGTDEGSFLLPVTSNIKDETDLKRHAVNLNDVVTDTCESGCKQVIILMDACRNNPLKKTKGSSRGLTTVSTSEVAQSVIFYACASGKTADDGDGDHSPFTQALLNWIGKPGYSFSQVVTAVTKEVRSSTKDMQTPVSSSTIMEEIYLNGKSSPSVNEIPPVYIDDKTDYSKVIRICVILFVVLLVVITGLFLTLTTEGKQFISLAGSKISSGTESTVNFVKNSSGKVKETVSIKYRQGKEALEEKKNAISEKMEERKEEKAAAIAEQKEAAAAFAEMKKQEQEEEYKAIKKSLLPAEIAGKYSDLYVAVSPVTKAQYKTIMESAYEDSEDNYPITNVTWYDCAQFFNKLSLKENLEPVYDLTDKHNIKIDLTKNGWRMPTVEEWKSFAVAPENGIARESWNLSNSNGELQECCKKQPNSYGLYDVYGLVWEWCNDVEKEKYHIAKGGAWDVQPEHCKASAKLAVTADFSDDVIGVRGVRNR